MKLHGWGVSGNLKPAWKLMKENTPEAFVEALKRKFLAGGGVETLDTVRDFANKRK